MTKLSNAKPPSTPGGANRASGITDPSVAGLVELGLTTAEARAYVALLRRPLVSAAEVAASSELARPKVYEALRLLEERGFCHTVAGEPVTRFRPVPPERALPGWIAHREHERLLGNDHDARVASDLMSKLPDPDLADDASGELYDYFEAIVGRMRSSEALSGMFNRAERAIAHMTQPPFVQPRSRWNVAEVDALRRGVSMRTLYTPEAIADDERWLPLLEAGAQVRVSEAIPMKLLIRDGAEAMVSLRDPASGEQGANSIVIRHPDLVRPLLEMFETTWKTGTKLDTYQRRTASSDR
jgi:sugar-specific transcriptional regulator TrmB